LFGTVGKRSNILIFKDRIKKFLREKKSTTNPYSNSEKLYEQIMGDRPLLRSASIDWKKVRHKKGIC
jgi:hypothetical protein